MPPLLFLRQKKASPVTAPQYYLSPPNLLVAAADGKMTADVQMKDSEPQPAAPTPAAAAAPAVSTLHRKLFPSSLYGTLASVLIR